MTDSASPRLGRVDQLDTLRGIAVVLVILHHSLQAFDRSAADVASGVAGWLDLGRMGVVIFFMISGFVIVTAMPGDGSRDAGVFWKHRFFRLYPPFWISIALAVMTARLVGSSDCCVFNTAVSPVALLANLTMIPLRFHQPMLLGIFWTLELELLFYVLVTVIRLLHRSSFTTMCIMASVLFAGAVLAAGLRVLHSGAGEIGKDQQFLAMLHLSLMFFGGAVRYHWDRQKNRNTLLSRMPAFLTLYLGAVGAFFLGVVAIKLTHAVEPNTFRVALSYLLSIAAFLICLRYARGSKFGLFLGNRSYGLYLVHLPVMSLVSLAMASWSIRLAYLPYLAIVSALSIGIADLLRRHVERHAIRFAHRDRLASPLASGPLPPAAA